MTGRIKIHSAFVAEDARFELENKVSLMGVAADGVVELSELPSRRKLIFILLCDVIATGEVDIRGTIRVNGEVKASFDQQYNVDPIATGVLLPVAGTNASFEEEGEIELLVSFADDEEGDLVKAWPVRLVSQASSDV